MSGDNLPGMDGSHEQPMLVPTGDVSTVVKLGVALQGQASRLNIHNVFDDGGYKELILLTMFGLKKMSRTGNDAQDDEGRHYEIKTVARVSSTGEVKPNLQVTTEHTLTMANLDRYREAHLFIVAVFDQSQPEAIYEIAPSKLEPYFTKWEKKLAGQQEVAAEEGGAPVHLNNPKIPINFVIKHGLQVWPPKDVPVPEEIAEALDEADRLGED